MFPRLLYTLLLANALYAQTAAAPEQVAAQLAEMHDSWDARASTPNIKLTIAEQSHSGREFRYRLQAAGIPSGTILTVLAWPVTQRGPAEVLRGVTFSESGLAVCAGRPGTCGDAAKPDDPIEIPFRTIPGEPLRLAVVSQDSQIKAYAKIVPLPLQGEDKGCSVSATLLTSAAELLFVEGSGLAPNSELTLDTESEGEKHSKKSKADAQGRYRSIVLPYKQGLTRGVAEIRLKTDACAPAVKVPWGRQQ